MTEFIWVDAKQKRGVWVAEVTSGAEQIGLSANDRRIPVIIEDEYSRVDWSSMTYTSRAADSHLEAWWYRQQHAEWRSLMLEGRPFLLRRGMDWNTRTAGKKTAIFGFEYLEMTETQFTFRKITRLAECKK